MSQYSLSASDVLAIRLALGDAIKAHPSPTLDFPFAHESIEKLVALLDLALSAAAPGAAYALSIESDCPTNDVNLGQQHGDKTQSPALAHLHRAVSPSSSESMCWPLTLP
jgi:hypothetical protein